ncbi:acyltransferase [Sutcliffiella cohnii]|uniref:acyltransferase n=1 Tax=Sutcliffiella cohnii TaxID=33932 RepID=UPI00399D5B93
MKLLLLIRKLVLRLTHPHRFSSDAYIKHLRASGCSIDEGTYFFNPIDTQIDVSRPYLLKIGKYCKITSGVHILTHDYSTSVIRMKYGKILNTAKQTIIGDNVFIGIRSIIMPGVTIGDNVIIGSGSIVTRDVPDNVVVGGNPAKIIMSTDEYKEKREGRMLEEAVLYAQNIKENKGKTPTIGEMGDFYPLYFAGSIDELNRLGFNIRCNGDNINQFNESIKNNAPQFNSFEDFLKYSLGSEKTKM